MRSTLVTLALIAGCASGALAAQPKPHAVARTTIYACFESEVTNTFYKLAGQGDPDSKRRRDSFMADAGHADPRLCRFFDEKKPVTIVLPDTGTDYTCITDKAGYPNDKFCYWARTMDLDLHTK